MGFFKHNYSVPGKGLTREEAMKRSYFGILGRKLIKLIELNAIFVFSNIIQITAFVFMILPFIVQSDTKTAQELGGYVAEVLSGERMFPVYVFIPFMLMGPTSVGINYICRNFAKQESCFVWSDFWRAVKANFRQGLFAGIIISLVYYLYINAAVFYLNSPISTIVSLVTVIILDLLITLTMFYVYPLIVTFDMKLGAVFKNALLMAFINLPQNLAAFASIVAVNLFLLGNLPIIVWIPLTTFFLIAWAAYTVNYVAWTAIDKFLIEEE